MIELDIDQLLDQDKDPPLLLVIKGAAEMMADGEEVDTETDTSFRNLSDDELVDKITRAEKILHMRTLTDGGKKLMARLRKLEAELEQRNRQKDRDKCKRVKTLVDESTCNGVTNLSHTGAPSSKPASEFGLLFCQVLENESTQEKQKNGLSLRQTPFKSPSHLSVNIDSQQQTDGEQRGNHACNTSLHPCDKDASCTKKEIGARSQLPLNSRRNNRKTVVLVDEEEPEVDVVYKADQVGQSKKTRIYYPSRDDPASIEICYSDMDCLAPESYLSSPIMNFYIRYLQKPPSQSARRKFDYHIFNTYFYTYLNEKLKQDTLTKTDREASFSKFRRWWKGVSIFEKAYIFLPIHENLHWSLVIICMPDKEYESWPIILHLDSLGLHVSKSIFSKVKSFLIEEWKFLRQEGMHPEPPMADSIWNGLSRRINEKVIEVPQQKNEYDCGLFVLYFMELFIDKAPERLKKQDMEMFGRQWFKPEEASSLRRKIQNLLIQEFENANEDTCEVERLQLKPGHH